MAAQLRFERGFLFVAFGAQLAIGVPACRRQLARIQRGAHGTARLVAVRAVAEAALRGQCLDVGVLGEILAAGELQLAHARRVDQAGAAGQRQQRAVRGGVAAAAVARAHRGGGLSLAAQQRVGERGLAGAGGAHQRQRGAGLQPGCEQRAGGGIFGIERQHRRVRGQRPRQPRDVRGMPGMRVGLGQQHQRSGAGAFDQGQIALRAGRVEIAVQPHQHAHGVDVGGDGLTRIALAGGGALEQAAPRRQARAAPAGEAAAGAVMPVYSGLHMRLIIGRLYCGTSFIPKIIHSIESVPLYDPCKIALL